MGRGLTKKKSIMQSCVHNGQPLALRGYTWPRPDTKKTMTEQTKCGTPLAFKGR